jgi:molecular chaperone DnaK
MDTTDVIGIDLGTTNSVVAIWDTKASQVKVLNNSEGKILTPSVVAFPSDQPPLVGLQAVDKQENTPEQVVDLVKRLIGRTFNEQSILHDQKYVSYKLETSNLNKVVIRIGSRIFTPSQVSAEVLRKLKRDAGQALGQELIKTVVTVPAYFNNEQREATKEAAKLAGLDVQQLLNEPTAAALAFGLDQQPQTIAVYDLGGGTFDISIVQIKAGGLFRVKAVGGETHLGGNDFDQAIVHWIVERVRQQNIDVPFEQNSHMRMSLRKIAEQAKITLSNHSTCVIDLNRIYGSAEKCRDIRLNLTREQLEQLIRPMINHTLALCEKAVDEAGLSFQEISQILLVGGQTRTPLIKEALHERFGWVINDSIDPDEAVAHGAAIMAARYCGYLKDRVRLMDVVPLSLGIETQGGKMEVLIRANQTVPTKSPSKMFTTARDGQEQITFRIYQGERPKAADNKLVGELDFLLATTRPKGAPAIVCILKVDKDGTLQVYAKDVDIEGEPRRKVFTHEYQLSPEEIEEQRRSATLHMEEDAITQRFFQIHAEYKNMCQFGKRGTEDEGFISLTSSLKELEAAINARDLTKAEALLQEIHQAHQTE